MLSHTTGGEPLDPGFQGSSQPLKSLQVKDRQLVAKVMLRPLRHASIVLLVWATNLGPYFC